MAAPMEDPRRHLQAWRALRLLLPLERPAAVGVGAHAHRGTAAQGSPMPPTLTAEISTSAPRLTFRGTPREWVESYTGRGSGGFRESTREGYRSDFERWVFPFFGDRLKYRGHAAERRSTRVLSRWPDRQDRAPAGRQHHPQHRQPSPRVSSRRSRTDYPHEPSPACSAAAQSAKPEDEDGEQVRPFTREQLAALEACPSPASADVPPLVEPGCACPSFSRCNGDISGSTARAMRPASARPTCAVASSAAEIEARQARRAAQARAREHAPRVAQGERVAAAGPRRFLPCEGRRSRSRTSVDGCSRRSPRRPGAPWAGFHTFRHTCASMLFERGANAKQVQRWLGHHSPSFTLDTYVTCSAPDLDEPLEAGLRARRVLTKVQTSPSLGRATRSATRLHPKRRPARKTRLARNGPDRPRLRNRRSQVRILSGVLG